MGSVMVAVVCTLVREARCSVMISYSLFKYLVLYGFVKSVAACVAFLVGNTNTSTSQVLPADFKGLEILGLKPLEW